MRPPQFDVLIVGRGIVGLAHALAAARLGLRTAVLDRETHAVGASVRNFGFVTVTGQQEGIAWRRARRARDVWAEVAGPAGIAVHHRGLLMVARRAEALSVLQDFAAGPMGEGCRLLRGADLPAPIRPGHAGGLHSPHELRVESRDAIPRLAAWLGEAHGICFLPRAMVHAIEPGLVATSAGAVRATHIVVAPGPDSINGRRMVSTVVGENLRVLGMDLNANPSSDQPAVARTATLEVTAQDAVKLALAGQAGTLSLALRRIGADQAEPVRPMLVKDLGSFDASPAPITGTRPTHVPAGPKHALGAPAAGGTVTVVEGATRASVTVPTEHFGLGAL